MHAYSFPDPDYCSDPAVYLRGAVEDLTGYTVVCVPGLRAMLEVDHLVREIRIRSGQLFRIFRDLLGRAALYIEGGDEWAPEFEEPRPRLQVVPALPVLTAPKQVISNGLKSRDLTGR